MNAWAEPRMPPPDATENPRGLSTRVAAGYPLGQDPLGWAMAVTCDDDHVELHGPEVDVGPELDRQLAALECDHVFTSPADHPERVRWLDCAKYLDVDLVRWASMPAGITYEVARLEAPGAGLLRVETIATYLRITVGETTTLFAGSDSANVDTVTEPFPFPFTVANLPLTWEWDIVEEMMADTSDAPQWAAGVTRQEAVPATAALRGPWTDNRYAWGSDWTTGHQHTIGGRAMVRLFVTLRYGAPGSLGAVRVGGGLRGFAQLAGQRAAALQNNTLRI